MLNEATLQRSDVRIEARGDAPQSLVDKIVAAVAGQLPVDLDVFLKRGVTIIVTVTPNGHEAS